MDKHPLLPPDDQLASPRGEVCTGPLRTDEEILARVDELIGPRDRQRQSLWLFFFDRGMRQMPVIVPIDDVPDLPDPEDVGGPCHIVAHVLEDCEPSGWAVMALTRPGPALFGAAEEHWYHALIDGSRQHRTRLRMLCVVTPDAVRELAPGSAEAGS
jgi:hypothetical protein